MRCAISKTRVSSDSISAILDDVKESELVVSSMHRDNEYQRLRQALSSQYDLGKNEPNIQVTRVETRGDRSLTLTHTMSNDRPLGGKPVEILKHVRRLWGFDIHLESVDGEGVVQDSYECLAVKDDKK